LFQDKLIVQKNNTDILIIISSYANKNKKTMNKSLRILGIVWFGFLSFFSASCTATNPPDSLLFTEKMKELRQINTSTPQMATQVALSFVGTPYVGKTLEINNNETLVVNLRELDCSTFLETVLSIVLTKKSGEESFQKYKEILTTLRYRNGAICGYESRLHYFSDWIHDNEQKGIVKDITRELGGIEFHKKINFMSTHSSAYKQLKNDSLMVTKIIETENALSSRKLFFIPKDSVATIESQLSDGMIVGITSAVDGLDIAHVGFLIRKDGQIRLLHASSDEGKIVVSTKSLSEYLSGNKKQTGIVVIKLNN